MTDLILGAVILAALSLGVFYLTMRLGAKLHPRLCDALAAAVLILLGFYVRDVWDNIVLAKWLPFSNLIVLGNGFPLAMAVLAGLAWNRVPPPTIRRVAIVALLFGSSAYAVYFPFRGQVPECGDTWEDGVCRQSTHDTCSAAAAATLLRMHQIEATEQEMAKLSITRKGTSWLGLYRGMKLKTAGTDWDVEVFSLNADEIQQGQVFPAIVFMRLTTQVADHNPEYEAGGWIVGTSHSSVLMEMNSIGICMMGDPSVGRELLKFEDFKQLYEGRGIRLVRSQK
jgi:predicted double-glycine peptidase